MPTYEYACRKCGKQFEKVQKISDAPVASCPECNSNDTERLISHSSFVLKGSGWYQSDYAGKSSSSPSCCGCKSGSCQH
ncbi:MAG TPA: zinc ribbon domain-containing protein [Myxococcota bacterium]|nr:zinc ribbon domain-containing protein [Myxococcota bacterium]HNZ02796.1 zinc ribbon domain-containing protein [Myxococcota bacterium]HOD07219.1 zinc ribbon domain-containing protein [Myxococcota bacterium]HPB49966.1 zinc ribbon domain-containing protein [Myxococcota bacterium]HQP95221.1 zinc ribbon domain-containing protein [Myxococcota bacterium]